MQKTRQFCQNAARLAVIIFPLFALANQAAAAQIAPQGRWMGVYIHAGTVIGTELDLKKFAPGDRSNSMKWYTPYDCILSLEYIGRLNGVYEMHVFSSNGGICDRYRDGVVDLTVQSDTNLQFSLKDRNARNIVQVNLSPLDS